MKHLLIVCMALVAMAGCSSIESVFLPISYTVGDTLDYDVDAWSHYVRAIWVNGKPFDSHRGRNKGVHIDENTPGVVVGIRNDTVAIRLLDQIIVMTNEMSDDGHREQPGAIVLFLKSEMRGSWRRSIPRQIVKAQADTRERDHQRVLDLEQAFLRDVVGELR